MGLPFLLQVYGRWDTLGAAYCKPYALISFVCWHLGKNNCKVKHPPGKKVYQRGAHTIWEIDGAKEKVCYIVLEYQTRLTFSLKLYCQNLALFGKLFIDVKTLFFDCDNCMCCLKIPQTRLTWCVTVMFYILTDAKSSEDHILGFFSKVGPHSLFQT